jgi:hypothetical protein
MALNPLLCTGWEHGVLSTNGGGIASTIAGTPTADAAAARSGSYGLLINPSASTETVIWWIATTGVRKTCARFYIRYTTLPNGAVDVFSWYDATTGQMAFFNYIQSTGRFTIQVTGGSAQNIGPNPVVANVWYRVDAQFDSSGTTWTCRAKLDGGAEVTATAGSHAATDQRHLEFGAANANTTQVANFDDFIWGTYTVDSEYWGPGRVVGLSPSADGTHNAGTNVIEANTGTDIGIATAFDLLNEVPISDTADYVQQAGTGTGNYAEVQFADLPDSASVINGCRALLTFGSATTTANAAETRIRRNDSSTDVIGVGLGAGVTAYASEINRRTNTGTSWDMSETAPFYQGCMVPATANGTDYGSLTRAIVNDLRARVGYATDFNPVPRWYALMLEVDFVEASMPGRRNDNRFLASTDTDPWSSTGWQ